MVLEEIINVLLGKKANLANEKEAELKAFSDDLDQRYIAREEEINKILSDIGYVEPVVETNDELPTDETVENVEELPVEAISNNEVESINE